jgi:quercetin dioxygenase-like cupin family protein
MQLLAERFLYRDIIKPTSKQLCSVRFFTLFLIRIKLLLYLKPYTESGSIVSRTIIDVPEGTITLFVVAKGQQLNTHSAPCKALLEVIDGRGVFQFEDKIFNIECGNQLIMTANKPHSVTTEELFKMILRMIKTK